MKGMKMLIACVLLLALGVLLAADAGSLLNCVLEGLMMLAVTAVAVASALAYERDEKEMSNG